MREELTQDQIDTIRNGSARAYGAADFDFDKIVLEGRKHLPKIEPLDYHAAAQKMQKGETQSIGEGQAEHHAEETLRVVQPKGLSAVELKREKLQAEIAKIDQEHARLREEARRWDNLLNERLAVLQKLQRGREQLNDLLGDIERHQDFLDQYCWGNQEAIVAPHGSTLRCLLNAVSDVHALGLVKADHERWQAPHLARLAEVESELRAMAKTHGLTLPSGMK